MQHIYGLFGFEYLELSTRPDNHLGEIETWNQAEAVSVPSFVSFISLLIFHRYSNSHWTWTNTTLENGTSTLEMAHFMVPKSTSRSRTPFVAPSSVRLSSSNSIYPRGLNIDHQTRQFRRVQSSFIEPFWVV